jgi:signal transduction histidine kinase
VCLPLAVIAALGWRLAREEQGLARQRLRALLGVRLQDAALVLENHFDELERGLDALTESVGHDAESIRRLVRSDPRIAQMFVLEADGTLVHPDPRGALNDAERRFLADAGDLFLHRDFIRTDGDASEGPAGRSGWVVRFWGPGLNLIYNRRLASGRVVGVLLQRARWIAEVIAVLPATAEPPGPDRERSLPSRIRLVDSHGQSIYEWGAFAPTEGSAALEELAPPFPLSSWRLQYFADDAALAVAGRGAYFNLLSLVAATGLALLMAGAWFFREYHRQVREAMERVSFANQVSHELKTPLTNIRMYAELLESDLEEAGVDPSGRPRGHLKVIVEESQRLSRLIGNVLTFAREQRGQLRLRVRPAVVDNVIAVVLERFGPALGRRQVEVAFGRGAGARVEVDVDVVEQILGNLLSNVEKYAASGKRVEVVSRQTKGHTEITVRDAGPGVPPRHRERVFRPFQRLSDDISESPGTGIGLSIARQLARLHGGDLRLAPSERGARFELRIATPRCESEAGA